MSNIVEILFIIVILIVGVSNMYVWFKYRLYSNEKKELSGFEVAKILCDDDVHIIKKHGLFLDHYNSKRNVIKLSSEVFNGTSFYANLIAYNIALKAHEPNLSLAKRMDFSALIVGCSYGIIILGSFLKNSKMIELGLLVFILNFIFYAFGLFIKKDELIEDIKDEEIIKLAQENNNSNYFFELYSLARYPYVFINFFR